MIALACRVVDGDTERTNGELDDGLRADVLDVLRDVEVWRMTGQRWVLIRTALDRLAAAVVRGDSGSVRDAVADLELLGPVRATRVGSEPSTPAPEPVREEINELVHTLDGRTPPSTTT